MTVPRETLREVLVSGLKGLGLQVSDQKIDSIFKFIELLKEWNEKTNLTSIVEDKEIITKHIIDSLSVATRFNFNGKKVIDIGTGGGLPGIPLKIVFQDMKIMLADSSKKKIVIVNNICKKLKFNEFMTLDENIENLGHKLELRNTFDFVLCRAVAPINILIEYGIPLLKIGGVLILYKGPMVEQEVDNSVNALNELKSKMAENIDFTLPLSDIKRHLILVEKIGITPEKYPRRVGIPRKRPL
jgi:16S rRNA (guanine527-N7)-methyltransferase